MICWRRLIRDGQGDFREQPVKNYTNQELLVTPTGHVDDEPGSWKLYQLILDRYRTRKQQRTIPELLSELRRLNIRSERASPAVTSTNQSNSPEWRREQVRFESEPGIELSGALYIPHAQGQKPAVLVVSDKTSTYWIPSTGSLAAPIAKTGRVVLELEVRDSPGEGDRPFVGNWLQFAGQPDRVESAADARP